MIKYFISIQNIYIYLTYSKMFFKKRKKEKWKKIGLQEYHKLKIRKNKYQNMDSNSSSTSYSIIYFTTIAIKYVLLVFSILIISNFIKFNNNEEKLEIKNEYNNKYNIFSDKWIIMNAINPPSDLIKYLEENITNWKIAVLGNIKTPNCDWFYFNNSNNLIYLSLQEQKNLGYNIIEYMDDNSYKRNNIGYLFAIQHGAKEIYEIDENLNIFVENPNFLDYNNSDSYVCYGIQNESKMINPYVYFGETNIWPRGFFIKDIMNDYNKTFYYAYNTQVKLKPLIYQDLINEFPDVDSFFLMTKDKNKENMNITFLSKFPLLYLPGNYVPINSKNTKFLYEIFPFLMLPMTINESISDIIRGYIIERFVYGFGGTIVYNNTNIFKRNNFFDNNKLFEEKKILMHLDKILEIIKSNNYKENNPKKLLFHILDKLIKKDFLKKEEKLLYKTFFNDLSKIGYKYSIDFCSSINNNYMDYLNISSELIFYIPPNPNILKGYNRFKIFSHSSYDKVYNDVLLIINYNIGGFLKLNEYLEGLYKKNFPNIVYLYPSNIGDKSSNIIECTESYVGYYSYKCIDKVYKKFPNYKGYLLINDDNYMKVWELENLDFDIPWLYPYEAGGIIRGWCFYGLCYKLFNIAKNNTEWKKNMTNFFGMFNIFNGFADLYYIPNYYVPGFTELLSKMYESRIFLECAVLASFAIISAPKYQLMHIRPLWTKERERALTL